MDADRGKSSVTDKDKSELLQMEEKIKREISSRPVFLSTLTESISGITLDQIKSPNVMEVIVQEVNKQTTPNGHQQQGPNKRNRDEERRNKMEIEDAKPPKKEPPPPQEDAKRHKMELQIANYNAELWKNTTTEFLFRQYIVYHSMCAIDPNYKNRMDENPNADYVKSVKRIIDAFKCLTSAVGAFGVSDVREEAFILMQRTTNLVAFPQVEKIDEPMTCSITNTKTKKGKACMVTFRVQVMDKNRKPSHKDEFKRVMSAEWTEVFYHWASLTLSEQICNSEVKAQVAMRRDAKVPDGQIAMAVVNDRDFTRTLLSRFKIPLCFFYERCNAERKKILSDHFGLSWFSSPSQ